MTNWIRATAFAAILALQGCGDIAAVTSPTLLVRWRAVGNVQGEAFDATGEIACIPVAVGTTFTTLGHEAFPRWTRLSLNSDRALVLDVSATCYAESLTQESILLRGYVLENTSHPRWVEPISLEDWEVRLEQASQRIASSSDRQRVIRTAQALLRGMDIFCVACDPSQPPDPFTRIVRKDISGTALPREFFERWGDTPTGSCRRSRPILTPGFLEQSGLEERHLSTCIRLRREDPLSHDAWPRDERCEYLDARLSTITPNGGSPAGNRIWRRSEFADPLQIDDCAVALEEAIASSLRRGPDAGDVRIYQSSASTFTLYSSGAGLGILQLYERNPTDLRRANLESIP